MSCSTIISWGRSREKEAFERILDEFSSVPVSVVSDSYDIFNACKHIWGDKLKERVIERSQDSCLVIRPDSGDPAETLIEVEHWGSLTCLGSGWCPVAPESWQPLGATVQSASLLLEAQEQLPSPQHEASSSTSSTAL